MRKSLNLYMLNEPVYVYFEMYIVSHFPLNQLFFAQKFVKGNVYSVQNSIYRKLGKFSHVLHISSEFRIKTFARIQLRFGRNQRFGSALGPDPDL